MKIERMNKGPWNKLQAYFDVATDDGFIIKGFKLVEGINGLFVSMPSQKGNDDEWHDTVWVESKQLREELTKLAINTFNETSNNQSISNTQNSGSAPEPETTGDNITSEVSEAANETSNNSFSDDDIPF